MKDLQRGFVIPLVITIIALFAIGGGVYYSKNKNIQPAIDSQDNLQKTNQTSSTEKFMTFTGITSDGRKYTFQYHYGLSVSSENNYVFISKLRRDRVIKRGTDCGGFLAEPDELRMRISFEDIKDSPQIVTWYDRSAVINAFSQKLIKGSRNSPGVCENGDDLGWKDDDKIVVFNIRPSNTNLIEEYKTIIETFAFSS